MLAAHARTHTHTHVSSDIRHGESIPCTRQVLKNTWLSYTPEQLKAKDNLAATPSLINLARFVQVPHEPERFPQVVEEDLYSSPPLLNALDLLLANPENARGHQPPNAGYDGELLLFS